jgi:hypothetical protein
MASSSARYLSVETVCGFSDLLREPSVVSRRFLWFIGSFCSLVSINPPIRQARTSLARHHQTYLDGSVVRVTR